MHPKSPFNPRVSHAKKILHFMNPEYHHFVAGVAPYSKIKWGVNPEDPSLPELLWVENSCALAVAADQPYDSAWGPGDQRLPFVYQHWMDMGAPSVAELQGQASAGGSPHIPPLIPALVLNPPVSTSPSPHHPTSSGHRVAEVLYHSFSLIDYY